MKIHSGCMQGKTKRNGQNDSKVGPCQTEKGTHIEKLPVFNGKKHSWLIAK
jgi:hypothetical protein